MENAVMMERWRRQLEACCGPVATKPKPLTGIERHFLEVDPLEEIEAEYRREFRAV